jgi:hypothetical protein
MAQVVNRWSPRIGIGPRTVHVGCMVGKLAQGPVSVRFFACHHQSTDVSLSFGRRYIISAIDSVVK